MRLYRIVFIVVAVSAAVYVPARAQNRILLSQYMYNGLVLNPAYAGSQQQVSLAASYRRQWLNVNGAPRYALLTTHTPLAKNRVGLGLLGYNEQIGVHIEWGVYAQIAYKIKLRVGYLSLGVSGGVSRRSSNYSILNVLEREDTPLTRNTSTLSPNFGVGVYYYSSRWYAGLSVPYLLNQRRIEGAPQGQSVLRDVRSYYATVGVILGRDGGVVQYLPSILLRLRDNTPLSADVNLNVILFQRVLIGGSYRFANGAVLLTQLILNKNFRLMYSYDFTTTSLARQANGTHEIMLNYRVLIPSLIQDKHCSAYF